MIQYEVTGNMDGSCDKRIVTHQVLQRGIDAILCSSTDEEGVYGWRRMK